MSEPAEDGVLVIEDKRKPIKLIPIAISPIPTTYEEWVEIHGEPEYLYEKQTESNGLSITITDCELPQQEVDASNIFREDKKGRRYINYAEFAKVFAELNPSIYCNGQFYTPEGVLSDGLLRQDIAHSLADNGWEDRLDVPTNAVMTTLKDFAFREGFKVNPDLIPFANGDLHLHTGRDWEFRLAEKDYTPYRLNVKYNPTKAPTPLFDKWLHDLFEDEDIPTIQEIFGYMLVPTTAAQEAFFLVGEGGVGKSVIGTIIRGILGNGFVAVETKNLAEQRFQVSAAENKLVVYDDDLGEAALEKTGLFKKLITADQPIPAERKYKDAYNFVPYCKVIACANFMISSLYDDSDGFYRRLHPIKVKSRNPDNKVIRNFGQMIVNEEKEQIVNWALAGLKRLIANGWSITWSERSRESINATKRQGVHYPDFIEETLNADSSGDVSSAELQKLYTRWCKENGIAEVKAKRMLTWLKENKLKYGLSYDNCIIRSGKRVRGFRGRSIKAEWRNTIPI